MKVNFRNLLFSTFLVLSFLSFPLFSQVTNDYGFTRSFNFPIVTQSNDILKYPWVGGLNSCQFCTMDLNFDGISDLIVFDRNGNRILTFINHGTPNSIDYVYDPQYEKYFPTCYSWLILKDYNGDGKQDIFTYGFGGITVYKNVSDPVTGLAFEMVTYQLLSYMYNGYVNIYVTDVDYPAIVDMDGDGDLDILAFWILGTFIHYHRNLSMENYGNADSLKFRLKSNCWGYIREGDTSNYITMDAPCPVFQPGPPEQQLSDIRGKDPDAVEHVGSTLLCLDLNADSLQDLILGDVDYPNVIGLINGGSRDTARIVSQDDFFPSYDTSIHIISFPVTNYVDVNNDGKRDLIASPFDPSNLITESDHSVWMYLNQGEDNHPDFHLETREFLQGDMIDAGTTGMPVFCDVDQDGLTDIVLGNFGFYDSSYYSNGFLHSVFRSRLTILHNTGTASLPKFDIADEDFAGVSALNITNAYPAFGDLDHDGDLDMLLGNSDGTLYYYENVAGPGNPLAFAPPVADYQNIDVGFASTPQLWDLDNDGKLDLVIGEKKGQLSYYRNTGTTQNPVFTWVTDSLGKVDVRDPLVSWDGYSVPCFFKTPEDSTRLFMGSLKGGMAYYKNIDGHLTDTFTLVDQNYLFLKYGLNSSVAAKDIDNDGFIDVVMGNTAGGLAFYRGTIPSPIGIPEISQTSGIHCEVFPNPSGEYCTLEVAGYQQFTNAQYNILDIGGHIVGSGVISQLPARIKNPAANGLYFLQLTFFEAEKKMLTVKPLKIIVMH